MSLPDATHVRLDGLENAVKQMSERIGAMAEFIQRLVVLEERNSYVNEQMKEMKESFRERVNKLEVHNETLEKKLVAMNESVIRLGIWCSIFSGLVGTVMSLALKKFVGV